MTAEEYVLSVISAGNPRPGAAASLVRGFLGGCAGLYDAGLEAYLAAERAGIRKRGRLPSPVISIGNLTVGGTGKTPMTAMLCQKLQQRGLRVTILSRGHGGSTNDARVVSTPDGDILQDSADAGDEPVLLARLCPGVPVVVGKDRRLSGREALRNWPVDVFVLDDGFQFWQLARDLDIVLLDSKLPFDNGHPLPRGLLREPARHIRRAHMAVVTRAGRLDAAARAALAERVHGYAPAMPIYFADHVPAGFIPVDRREDQNTVELAPQTPVVALSAIAQPDSFHRALIDAAGCRIARALTHPDHHRLTPADIADAQSAVVETRAKALVMTEKDAVKWPIDRWTSDIPVYALRIGMQVENESEFLSDAITRTFNGAMLRL